MDAFEVQSKEAADEVNALWGLKMKGVLDTAQYQKAKAKVMAALNAEASQEGTQRLTGIGRPHSPTTQAVASLTETQEAANAEKEAQAPADQESNQGDSVESEASAYEIREQEYQKWKSGLEVQAAAADKQNKGANAVVVTVKPEASAYEIREDEYQKWKRDLPVAVAEDVVPKNEAQDRRKTLAWAKQLGHAAEAHMSMEIDAKAAAAALAAPAAGKVPVSKTARKKGHQRQAQTLEWATLLGANALGTPQQVSLSKSALASGKHQPMSEKYQSPAMKDLASYLAEKAKTTDPSISLPPSVAETEKQLGEKEALLEKIEVGREEEAKAIDKDSRKAAALTAQIKALTLAQHRMSADAKLRVEVSDVRLMSMCIVSHQRVEVSDVRLMSTCIVSLLIAPSLLCLSLTMAYCVSLSPSPRFRPSLYILH